MTRDPIDTPDDFLTDDEDRGERVIVLIAAALLAAIVIAAITLIWSLT